MEQKKQKKGKKSAILLLSLITLFFVSFSASAWIYINANRLVFVDDIEAYKKKAEEIDERESEIEAISEKAERYQTLYEALRKQKQDIYIAPSENKKEDDNNSKDNYKNNSTNAKPSNKNDKDKDDSSVKLPDDDLKSDNNNDYGINIPPLDIED